MAEETSDKDSILNDIKQLFDQSRDDDTFDLDLTTHINTCFFLLNQLGVGPTEVFEIEDSSTKWADFFGGERGMRAVKSYIYSRVRLYFDPPTNAFLVTQIEEQIKRLEFSLSVAKDRKHHND